MSVFMFVFYANAILIIEDVFLWLVNLYDKDLYGNKVTQCTRYAPDWLSSNISTPSIFALHNALKEHLYPATLELLNVLVFAVNKLLDWMYENISLQAVLRMISLLKLV